jgi:large subunit ribosomal protein L25
MAKAALKVMERTEKSKKVRRNGFTPGIIYGEGIKDGIPIKFEILKLRQLLKDNLTNAKLYVKLGEDNRYCIIKDIQRDPVSGSIIHVDMQAVSTDEIIKLKVPVIYNGLSNLELKRLALQIDVSELEVEGRVDVLPEAIHVDVGAKGLGDRITLKDLELEKAIKAHIDENEALAIIVAPKETADETEEEKEPAE